MKDLTEQRFNRWLVMKRVHPMRAGTYYECQCNCGIIRNVRAACLVSGESQSCGCLAREISSIVNTKLVKSTETCKTYGTLPYFKSNTWGNIQARTINGRHQDRTKYKAYFRKGIKVLISKDEYYKFCNDNKGLILHLYSIGEVPSINRICPNGHYELGNLEIITNRENTLESSVRNLEVRIKAATLAKLKPITLIHPDGTRENFVSIIAACVKYSLTPNQLSKVARGEHHQHKGYKAIYKTYKAL